MGGFGKRPYVSPSFLCTLPPTYDFMQKHKVLYIPGTGVNHDHKSSCIEADLIRAMRTRVQILAPPDVHEGPAAKGWERETYSQVPKWVGEPD